MTSSKSVSTELTPNGETINGVLIFTMGSNTIKINENIYEITDGIHKALSLAGYSGKNMKKDSDFLMLNITKKDIRYTGVGNRSSKRRTFLLTGMLEKVAEIQSKPLNEDEAVDLQGQGMKIIHSNVLDIWTRLKFLQGLTLFGHVDTLTEAKNLMDELHKRGEIQTEEQYRNALDKF